MTYDGAVEPHGFQRVWARTSTDGGSTWSGRVLLSNPAQQSGFPMTIGGTGNDVRMWFLQTRGGNLNAWNVYFRSSADGGRTWTRRARLSDVTSGYAYLSPRGFREPYGDYGEIAITSTGATFAVWGEGMSYPGPRRDLVQPAALNGYNERSRRAPGDRPSSATEPSFIAAWCASDAVRSIAIDGSSPALNARRRRITNRFS